MEEIKSTQNELVKYIVKLQNPKFRKNEKLILIDGNKTIDGLISDKIQFEYVFLKSDSKYLKIIKSKKTYIVNDAILKKISTVKTPTDIVCVMKEPEIHSDNFKNLKKIVLIDGIKDAGNLGTIIRSAVAFSIDGIILVNDCVDLFNSKVIRASAQNMFKIPILNSDIEFVKKLSKNHKLISMVVNSNEDFMDYNFEDNFILMMGSEANGLCDELINMSDKKLTFKMDNNVESLNLAICSSIAFAFIKLNHRLMKL